MKLITWNCQGAFRKRQVLKSATPPDIRGHSGMLSTLIMKLVFHHYRRNKH